MKQLKKSKKSSVAVETASQNVSCSASADENPNELFNNEDSVIPTLKAAPKTYSRKPKNKNSLSELNTSHISVDDVTSQFSSTPKDKSINKIKPDNQSKKKTSLDADNDERCDAKVRKQGAKSPHCNEKLKFDVIEEGSSIDKKSIRTYTRVKKIKNVRENEKESKAVNEAEVIKESKSFNKSLTDDQSTSKSSIVTEQESSEPNLLFQDLSDVAPKDLSEIPLKDLSDNSPRITDSSKRKRKRMNYSELIDESVEEVDLAETIIKSNDNDKPEKVKIVNPNHKKRGRKRLRPLTPEPTSVDVNAENATLNDTKNLATRKRPGRPRKVPQDVADSVNISDDVCQNSVGDENFKNGALSGSKNSATPKRPGRPRKVPQDDDDSVNISNDVCSTSIGNLNSENVTLNNSNQLPTPKRPGRPRKVPKDVTDSLSISESNELPEKHSGRPHKVLTKAENEAGINEEGKTQREPLLYKQQRLLIGNLAQCIKKEMENSKPQNPSKAKQNCITCAICKETLKSNKEWSKHLLMTHQNVSWTIDEDPIDFDDVYKVLGLLKVIYDKKLSYVCTFCRDSKKSLLGFLTHKVTCNKSPEEIDALKEQCDQCDKLLLPFQLVDHERMHRVQGESEKPKHLEEIQVNNSGKRRAAEVASKLISKFKEENAKDNSVKEKEPRILSKLIERCFLKSKKIEGSLIKNVKDHGTTKCFHSTCDIVFDNADKAFEHVAICSKKCLMYYWCKVCQTFCSSYQEGKDHVQNEHADMVGKANESSDEYQSGDDSGSGDMEEEKKRVRKEVVTPEVNQKGFWNLRSFQFYCSKLKEDTKQQAELPKHILPSNYDFMLKFCENNYCQKLFPNYFCVKGNCFPVNKNYIADYLPKYKVSIKISEQRKLENKKEENFKRFKLFESAVSEDFKTSTIFCGGSITALSWAPTPHVLQGLPQILAVAINPDPDQKHLQNQMYAYKSLIQFWNFGSILNEKGLNMPNLDVCMAHNYGNILAMEWCPSGCYQRNGTRLGLLAIACTDSNVYCFSIGHANFYSEKLVKPKPSFQLVLSKNCDIKFGWQDFYPTRISWSKAKDHKYMAVGYSQGLVALFNLKGDNSCLSEISGRNVQMFYPYLTFQAHKLSITGLSLLHCDGGNRYLVSSSMDKLLKFWNLGGKPLRPFSEIKRAPTRNLIVPLVSISAVVSNDAIVKKATALIHPRDIYSQCNNVMNSNVPAFGLSGSDWGGIIYQGNMGGELICSLPKNNVPMASDIYCKKFLCSEVMTVSDKTNICDSEQNIDEYSSYKEAHKNTKLIFHDIKVNGKNADFRMPDIKSNVETDISKFQTQAINALATNPNRFSFLYTAVGYNVGFVRVFHSKFLGE